MPQRQFNQLSDLSDLVEVALLVLTLNRLALAMDDGILCDNTELRWVDLDNLELHLSHTTAGCESVALTNRSVGFAEVWGKENVEQRSGDALDCVGDGENCDALGLQRLSVSILQ
jgi:hypothetical protein